MPAILFLTILTLLMFAAQAFVNQAIRVKLRTDESISAPVLETVNLYGASHALVIGIDNYTHGWPILSGATNDAKLVADALKKKGFDVILKLNLNAETLQTEFKNFFITKGADPEARLFVWFAGHGHIMKGQGYLIPADAPRPSQKVAFKLKALSMRRFGEYVRLAESKHAFAVFDSCFSGTIFTAQRTNPPAAVTRATTLPVRQFLSSGDADQAVSDNGLFRKLFIWAINIEEMADANQDGYITGSELGLFLTDRITNLTSSAQTPRYGKLRDADYDRGDFVFAVNKTDSDIEQPGSVVMPKESGSSFDDLLKKADKTKAQKNQWQRWQTARNKEYSLVKQIDNNPNLTRQDKKIAWQRILSSLKQDNPYSSEDNQIRTYAMGRKDFWDKFKPKEKKKPIVVKEQECVQRDGRFCKLPSGPVQDTTTGLMWASRDNGGNIYWGDAKRYCETYSEGGYTDWRMPTIDELAALYDKNKGYRTRDYNWVAHITQLIRLTTSWPWASNTSGSKAAIFTFLDGIRLWGGQSFSHGARRVLPVRVSK